MELGLEGKVVVVTGGSKGIGFACAKAFLGEGARVGIVARSAETLARAKAELGDVATHAANLIDAGEALAAIKAMEARLGPIDILVTSAGAAQRTPADDLTPAHWRAAMDAKYFSYINVIDPVIKRMGVRGRGVIVNVIGNGGKVASPIHIAGGAANAALMLATAGLANAYAGKGVRVVGLNPGLTATGRVEEGMRADAAARGVTVEEALKAGIAKIPLGRMAAPEDVGAAALFLASERAGYITGVNISMDGAQTPMVV